MGYFRKNVQDCSGYSPGFQQGKDDIVKLNTNENPYPPAPEVIEAVKKTVPQQLRRYPDPTANAFRQVAAKVNRISADCIICGNGADELLSVAFRAFCDSSRPVAYPVPTYSLYPVMARLQNCRAIQVPFDGEFNLPAKLSATKAALTIVCNPNAPSGSVVSVQELASLAEELAGVLLIDEAYVDFAEENCISLAEQFDNVIILRSMSKGYSLAGLRFGYAVADAGLIEGLMKVRDSYSVDVLAQSAAAAAISNQDYFRRNVKKVKAERTKMTEGLRGLGFVVADSSANFVLAACKNCRATEVYDKLSRRNIYVRYFDSPELSDKLRITIGTAEQNAELLSALKEILLK